MTRYIITIVLLGLFTFTTYSQTTEFTFQGSLKDGAGAANANYDFEFALFDAVSAGNQIGPTIPKNNVPVANGIFSVKLDFGSNFPGASRFLEIRVKQTGGGAFTALTPRQAVTSAPYSVKSLNADQLGGAAANQYVTTTSGNTNYIQNTASPQATSNFNISGTGTADIFNAATQYNIGGNRILSNLGINNLSAGIGAGANLGGQASRNSFFGALAGRFTGQSSFDNAMFGYNAVVDELPGHTTNRNSLFGSSTYGTSFSSDLTLIGYGARTAPLNPLSNSTAIGSRAQVSASNSLVLGSINGINGATADTNVGIGTTAPTFKLTISDSSNTGLRVVTAGPGGTVASFGGIGAFQVDAPFNPGGRFNIAETGHISFSTLGSGGNETLCRNFSNFQISTCGSSLRYKQNINPFVSGLLLIKQLRPISFNWKDGGMPDLGLGAEDVAAIEPLLVTYNKDGLVEGVKYDRIGVVLVNAVKEQQAQIEAQKKMIELQKIEAAEQKAANQRLQSQMDELKKVVCTLKPDVEICKSGGK